MKTCSFQTQKVAQILPRTKIVAAKTLNTTTLLYQYVIQVLLNTSNQRSFGITGTSLQYITLKGRSWICIEV